MSYSQFATMLEAEDVARNTSEARVTARLLDYWHSLSNGKSFPSRDGFRLEAVNGLGPYAFTLDFSRGYRDPTFRYVGQALTENCGRNLSLKPVSEVPRPSALTWVTDHYMDVIADRAPVTFEDTYANGHGSEVVYRGIMLPLSEDGENIDFVIGAITYKAKSPETTLEDAADVIFAEPENVIVANGVDIIDTLTQPTAAPDVVDIPVASAPATPPVETKAEEPEPAPVNGLRNLTESLDYCRALAREVDAADLKSRKSLYRALESAYAFYFECEVNPDAYEDLRAKAEIGLQDRAPFTPIVKLIFGKSFDRKRLSEYATALAYAKRHNQIVVTVRSFIEDHEDGIKGCVKAERAARRAERGEVEDNADDAKKVLRRTRAIGRVKDTGAGNAEFVVMLGRRVKSEVGTVQILRVLDEKDALVEGIVKRTAKKVASEIGRPIGDDD